MKVRVRSSLCCLRLFFSLVSVFLNYIWYCVVSFTEPWRWGYDWELPCFQDPLMMVRREELTSFRRDATGLFLLDGWEITVRRMRAQDFITSLLVLFFFNF